MPVHQDKHPRFRDGGDAPIVAERAGPGQREPGGPVVHQLGEVLEQAGGPFGVVAGDHRLPTVGSDSSVLRPPPAKSSP